ncbi:nickel/cobalt efflux transporter RcnA [Caballeronia novacaledonica]|uniref:nickel/cobalt efflux transporter n=1 Tax=Caballeronia novacaledonica TaxID=1544861 RepID=UPI001EE17F2A|nr:nickel/cobalt efflux transporter [Caballeronia novacaledonica]GJH13085.1 nickel/cobalt efflux transporter RcnA [Caballeronia novacaledonica]
MASITALLQQGTTNFWLLIPSAIILGALHGLEPGHSKTMMAAFIISIRGTVLQAVLLGLCATLSHTAVVWVIALGGQYFGRSWSSEASEPYLQLASAALVFSIAIWMVWRTRREQRAEHHHDHHCDDVQHTNTGHGVVALQIFEDGVPPRFRMRFEGKTAALEGESVRIETTRPDGTKHVFVMLNKGTYFESAQAIPEPHEFKARLSIGHSNHWHDFEVAFSEHGHGHSHMNLGDEDDAHARAHADDIRRRFQGRTVTTGQIMMFGLTGGLIPCPAAITVLLPCVQLKQLSLGFLLVMCFSIGLAATMVSAGVLAALSIRHVEKRWSGFADFARRAPYVSAVLILCGGFYMAWSGWQALPLRS